MKELFRHYDIGHFINNPSSTTEFEILRFDEMSEPDVDNIHKHTFYEILWAESGESIQTIDYQNYKILPNSLFFISPNQVHQFEQWESLTGGTILFTEAFLVFNHANKNKLFELTFLDNFYANPMINLGETEFNEIKHTIDLMLQEQKRRDRNDTIIQSLLNILLTQVQRCINNQAEKHITKKYILLYKQFKNLLDSHFADNQTSGFYAQQLSITQHHLNLVCKNVTGKTVGEVIRTRNVLEAKRLLTFSDLTVSEIANALSYLDGSYFAKLFKAETGLSPISFRTQMSDKYRLK